jgi:hypothetical protein
MAKWITLIDDGGTGIGSGGAIKANPLAGNIGNGLLNLPLNIG